MQQKAHEIWLWSEIRYGNERALYQVYMDNYDHLFRYGLHVVADRTSVMECINEVFTDVWARQKDLPHVEHVQGYLFVIFKRKLFYKLKHKKNLLLPESENDFFPDQHECSYETMLIAMQTENEMKLRISEAIEKLTSRQRELIRMRYFDDCSMEEIAEKTALSLRTIYNTIHSAFKTLRKELQGKKEKTSDL